MSESHTIVVGGGIIGVSAAYFLARGGERVTLVERDDGDDGASAGNAGLIAVGHGPLPRPGLTAQTVRWMLDGTSPLYIVPRLDPALFTWLWRFRQACGRAHHARSVAALLECGLAAGTCFRRLIDEESIDCDYHPAGQLDVFRTKSGLAAAADETKALRPHGYRAEVIDGNELCRRDPAYRSDLAGAVAFHDRAHADPQRFLLALRERAVRHGAALRLRTPVARLTVAGGACTGVVTETGETISADRVLLAAGVWSSALARAVGVRVPMQAGKGYHIQVAAPDPAPRLPAVLAERFVAVTPLQRGLRLAGTLEFSGINRELRPERLHMLRQAADPYLADIGAAPIVARWCGLRPCTADGLPVIGWAPGVAGLYVATGHAMMGFALGPLTGQLAAEALRGDRPSIDLTPYRADRPA